MADGTRQPVLELLERAERTLPVQDWSMAGLRVWPILRCYHAFEHITRGEFRPDNQIARYSGTVHRARQVAAATGNAFRYRWRDRAHNDCIHPADVVLLPNSSTRFFKVDGGWYTPYADSFEAPLRQSGVRTLTLELTVDGAYRVPRYASSVLIQDRLFIRSLLAGVAGRLRGPLPEERLDGFGALVELHDRFLAPAPRPSLARLRFRVRQVLAYARYFGSLLRQVRPVAAVTSGWYSTDVMGVNVACRHLGIASIEVQHGVQGDGHFAYRDWHGLPADGYAVMPTVFWGWSGRETAIIESWSHGNAHHRAMTAGNPCLELFDRTGKPLTDAVAQAAAAGGTGRAAVNVLYTVQAFYELPTHVIEAMRSSPPGWRWWVRVHPQYWETREPLRRMLAEAGVKDFLLDEASDHPMATVLAIVDVHVTEFSSSVLEAEALGVPSIVVDPRGTELYSDQIASGMAVYAADAPSLLAGVERQRARRDRSGGGVNRLLFQAGIETLVRMARSVP